MGIMRVDHPDILAFIGSKSDSTQLTNYNLSVAMTDDCTSSPMPDVRAFSMRPRVQTWQPRVMVRRRVKIS